MFGSLSELIRTISLHAGYWKREQGWTRCRTEASCPTIEGCPPIALPVAGSSVSTRRSGDRNSNHSSARPLRLPPGTAESIPCARRESKNVATDPYRSQTTLVPETGQRCAKPRLVSVTRRMGLDALTFEASFNSEFNRVRSNIEIRQEFAVDGVVTCGLD